MRQIDPWSVFVMALVLSLALAVVTMVAALVLYTILQFMGIPDSINAAVSDVEGGGDLLTRARFLGFGALLSAVNVILITVGATLAAMIYNVAATFTGGIELTLAERD